MSINVTHIKYFLLGVLWGVVFIGGSLYVQAQEERTVPLTILQTVSKIQATFHYPVIEDSYLKSEQRPDGKLIVKPYLTLPFRQRDLENMSDDGWPHYEITEGWTYSDAELAIHHVDPLHGGIDIAVPYGTAVVSPVDGYVMSSYHVAPLIAEDGTQRTYKDKPISMGLGYFVYIYVPMVKRWVEIAHLSEIDDSIPFWQPTKEENVWKVPTQAIKVEDYLRHPRVTFIKKGHPLGKVGHSGLNLGNTTEYKEGMTRPMALDQHEYPSWDEPHIHYEEFWYNQETGQKGWQRDPYGLYSTGENYPTYNNYRNIGKDSLWLLDEYNYPRFAVEEY